MFEHKTNHICAIHEETSRSFLPTIHPIVGNFTKLKRFLKTLILVTEINPQSTIFYKNSARIIDERKLQVATGSWIIHPFSIFRLYYEMWMVLGYIANLFIVPLSASFSYLLPEVDLTFYETICDCIFYIDIIMNFRTGYIISKEVILMKQSKIAKRYIFSPYFISDVLSSFPDLCDWTKDQTLCDIFNILNMLKIIRLGTLLSYLERTLNYFKVGGFKSLFTKTILTSLVLGHYCACLLYFSILLYNSITDSAIAREKSYALQRIYRHNVSDTELVVRHYLVFLYKCSSLLMGIEFKYRFNEPWLTYIVILLIIITGKILMTFLTVILLDIFKRNYYLEIRYQSMMCQIDSFMTAHQFPLGLQKRIRQFYSYRYRDKYLNEAKIEQFLSEKLIKEIRYHECRKLVQNVNIFEQFPQNILENILTLLKLEVYMPNDCIIKDGTLGDCMYFLSSGTVAVMSPAGKEICHLEDGAYFGELCLVVPKAKRSASIIALEICEVYKMDKKLFKRSIEKHPILYREIQIEAKRRYNETKEIDSTFINLSRT